ncbi:unconventional myosin-XV-like [Oncorhynchus keta]|uniref:unconventional myosin-XV-like n=1 Tax=Oncorhynchus keta TaxID=8018 RepID=UPI00227D2764|nr:unconventional myosin-XV-like [Oncorhynchus keta]
MLGLQAKTAGKDALPHQKSPAIPINKEPARKFAPVVTSPAPPAAEVVKSSVLPQVDIVPSSNIKDIIRQYDSPPPVTDALPPGKRRPEGKFMKMQNPRDEALQILKPQMDNPPPQPKRPLGPSPSAMALKEAGINPTKRAKKRAPERPQPLPLPVSRELPVEAETIQTQLHHTTHQEHYTYTNVPWKIYIRKEVFYPKDSSNHPLVLDLIFKQIVSDTLSQACVRISNRERMKMKSLFEKRGVERNVDEAVKKEVVTVAKESWDIYFSCLFPASGSAGTGVQVLSVSHTGIRLLKTVKSSTDEVGLLQSPTTLHDSEYVVAERPRDRLSSPLLAFHKGWKFGGVFGRAGAFPTDCVRPVAAPDFLPLPVDRRAELKGGAGRVAVTSAMAVAVASSAAAHEIDPTLEEGFDEVLEIDDSILQDTIRYGGVALDNRLLRGTHTLMRASVKSKKPKDTRDPFEMVRLQEV